MLYICENFIIDLNLSVLEVDIFSPDFFINFDKLLNIIMYNISKTQRRLLQLQDYK